MPVQSVAVGLVNVVVELATKSPVSVLTGLLKSALAETTSVIELTVMLLAVPCVTTIFVMLSLIVPVEYTGRSTSDILLPPIRHGFIVVLPITIHVSSSWVISLSVA